MAPRKAGNGEGTSTGIYLDFDPSDPDEARALAYARHIARPHGRRKKLLVLVLNMLADIEEATGRPLTAEGLGGKLSAMLFLGRGAPSVPQEIINEAPRIQVSTAQKATHHESAHNLAAGLANRFRR